MKPDIKAEWVAALRSGKYKQTTGILRDDEGFCCLGVLCDLVKDRVGLYWTCPEDYYEAQMMGYSNGQLPGKVYRFAGLDSAIPYVDGRSLVYLNDTQRWDFNAIADAIEIYL